jgi:hypothetical protein
LALQYVFVRSVLHNHVRKPLLVACPLLALGGHANPDL